MKFLAAAWCLLAVLGFGMAARAAATDDIADALVTAGRKPITAETLSNDFSRLARFVRHDANGTIFFTDGGPADGHIRHAQAQFANASVPQGGTPSPLFSIAFELVDQPDFTFEGLAAALEQRLGTPNVSSNQSGATFRTWILKTPEGRSFTIARAQGSDNGDPIIIVELLQKR